MTMALELILVHNNGLGFQAEELHATDVLGLKTDYKLFAQIDNEVMDDAGVKQVCKPHPVPPGFKVHRLDEESGWKRETEDPYGDPLTYVTAGELAKIKPVRELTDWNKAILAMMKALPSDFPVILWWC